MSIFTTELNGKMLPDVIAEIVEAWYDNQQIDNAIEGEIIPNEDGAITVDLMNKHKMSKATFHRILRGLKIKPSMRYRDGSRFSYIESKDLQRLYPVFEAWRKGMSTNEIIDKILASE